MWINISASEFGWAASGCCAVACLQQGHQGVLSELTSLFRQFIRLLHKIESIMESLKGRQEQAIYVKQNCDVAFLSVIRSILDELTPCYTE